MNQTFVNNFKGIGIFAIRELSRQEFQDQCNSSYGQYMMQVALSTKNLTISVNRTVASPSTAAPTTTAITTTTITTTTITTTTISTTSESTTDVSTTTANARKRRSIQLKKRKAKRSSSTACKLEGTLDASNPLLCRKRRLLGDVVDIVDGVVDTVGDVVDSVVEPVMGVIETTTPEPTTTIPPPPPVPTMLTTEVRSKAFRYDYYVRFATGGCFYIDRSRKDAAGKVRPFFSSHRVIELPKSNFKMTCCLTTYVFIFFFNFKSFFFIT